MVILSANDLVCIFVLFVVQMRCPAQDATGGWVMLGLVFKWFPLCEFSLFETPQGRGSLVVCHLWGCMELDMTEVMQQKQQQQRYFSGCLGSWSQCSHSKGSGLDLWSGTKIPQVICYGIK